MSDIITSKEKKRPHVSSKFLLNIKSIVSQNISLNTHNKTSSTSILPPLPLVDSLITSKEPNDRKLKLISNENSSKEKSHLKKQINIKNGHDRSNIENGESKSICEIPIHKEEHRELQSNVPSIVSKESNSEQYFIEKLNNNELTIIPPLPLNCSMYPFGSSSSSPLNKPLVSFPVKSSNNINEEYLKKMHDIIASSDNSDDAKPIELSIYHHRSIPIHRFGSASPTVSTVDDDEDDDTNLNGPLIFVNSSLNLSMNANNSPAVGEQNIAFKSRLSERSQKEYNQNRNYQPNFTRLPHSLRNKNPSFHHPSQSGTIRPSIINNPSMRRQFPQFESVRTPVQKSQSTIPSEVFDCCQTETTEIGYTQRRYSQRYSKPTTMENNYNESEARSNYFRDVSKIRQIMMNVSKRLTQDIDPMTRLPIVDTHCHFDLIFDRLRIKHNNLTKYFNDYNEYYPSGLSFELAIQVFWRPKQLKEDDWLNWYSKYLDDERVYGTCGVHPHWSTAWNETSTEDIERCLQHPKIIAIGEIGLDYGPKNTCLVHDQRRAFEGQLKLAAKWLKPIVIHSRDAYEDTFQLMKQYLEPDHKIHLHCFVGTMDDVYLFTSYFKEIKFGFTPIITRHNFLHTVIQQLELTQILSETDSPYFTPDELSTFSRCAHPGMVYSVVEMVAKLRHMPVFDIACQLRENARQIYGV